MGSPPPTRGILSISLVLDVVFGITPAYAGNTSRHAVEFPLAWDHPRLRGEYMLHVRIRQNQEGSPPPTRGILYGHYLQT